MSFQTPGGPAAKRRRIDAANVTLRKPFRSPLISRQQTETGGADDAQDSPNTQRAPATPVPTRSSRPATAAGATTAPSPLSTSSSLSTTATSTPQPRRLANPTSRPTTRSGLNPTPRSSNRSLPAARTPLNTIKPTTTTTPSKPRSKSRSRSNNHGDAQEEQEQDDGDNDDLLHQILVSQRNLTTHLRTTQQELELVRQARRIEEASLARRNRGLSQSRGQDGGVAEGQKEEEGESEGGNDAGLGAMVAKWKGASRLAAEELFELIKGRVEGMGGARAWRESRRPRGWDDDGFDKCNKGKGGVESEEGECEGEGEVEGREWEDEKGEEEEEESGETEFTMLMMLKSLNIEPDILGYDPVEDRWLD